MDIHQLYTELAIARSNLKWAAAWNYSEDNVIVCKSRVSELERKAASNRAARIKALQTHGVECVLQDEDVFALGSHKNGVWVWEKVTTCNLACWLGY